MTSIYIFSNLIKYQKIDNISIHIKCIDKTANRQCTCLYSMKENEQKILQLMSTNLNKQNLSHKALYKHETNRVTRSEQTNLD